MKDLTQGNITEQIITFAVPVALGQVFQNFYSLADTRIVGSVLGERALASVGAVSAVTAVMLAFLNGAGNGFSILTAQAYGAGDERGTRKSAAQSLLLAVLTAFLLGAGGILGMNGILAVLHVTEDLRADAVAYLTVLLAGMIVTALYNGLAGILRAVGDSASALLFLVLASLCNIGLDLLFIMQFGMGVFGAALATVLAQGLSVLLCILYMWQRYPVLRMRAEDFYPEPVRIRNLASTGASMGVMMSLVFFGTFTLQTAINRLGNEIIVAHTAARKVTELFMLPFGAFGTTMATFTGQNLGAGKSGRIRKGLTVSVLCAWALCLLAVLLAQLLGPQLISAVSGSSTPEVLKNGSAYLRFDTAFYFVPAVIALFRQTLQGLGDRIVPVFSSGIELLGKIIFALALTPVFGYRAVIWTEPAVWILMVIPLVVQMYRLLGRLPEDRT